MSSKRIIQVKSRFNCRAAFAAVLVAALWLCAAVPEAPAQTGVGVGAPRTAIKMVSIS